MFNSVQHTHHARVCMCESDSLRGFAMTKKKPKRFQQTRKWFFSFLFRLKSNVRCQMPVYIVYRTVYTFASHETRMAFYLFIMLCACACVCGSLGDVSVGLSLYVPTTNDLLYSLRVRWRFSSSTHCFECQYHVVALSTSNNIVVVSLRKKLIKFVEREKRNCRSVQASRFTSTYAAQRPFSSLVSRGVSAYGLCAESVSYLDIRNF